MLGFFPTNTKRGLPITSSRGQKEKFNIFCDPFEATKYIEEFFA